MTDAAIKEFLEEAGYPEHVCQAGRQGLLERWSRFVAEVEQGYELGLEDYRNELDVRALLSKLGLDEEARETDERFRRILKAPDKPVWETEPDGFWNYGHPCHMFGELLADLQAERLL
jgi:hypothetical protein